MSDTLKSKTKEHILIRYQNNTLFLVAVCVSVS